MVTDARALPVLGFANEAEFEAWLAAQPLDSAGLWLKLMKGGVGGLTKQQAIDAALCHGWIDGQLGKGDQHHWLVRFTPRRERSKWSEVNRTRALQLLDAGRIRAAGLREIETAKNDGRWDLAYAPQSRAEVPSDLQAALEANKRAAAFFASLTGANRYAILYRVADAKKPETRSARIAKFVTMLERHETLH